MNIQQYGFRKQLYLEGIFCLIYYGSSSLRKNENPTNKPQKPYENLVIRITNFGYFLINFGPILTITAMIYQANWMKIRLKIDSLNLYLCTLPYSENKPKFHDIKPDV